MPNYSDSASLDALFKHPAEAQAFWALAGDVYSQAEPHDGYEVLRKLCARQLALGKQAIVITTNIDGMARKVLSREPAIDVAVLCWN